MASIYQNEIADASKKFTPLNISLDLGDKLALMQKLNSTAREVLQDDLTGVRENRKNL